MGERTFELCLAMGVLSPMISFWLLVFFGPKMGKPAAGWFGVIMGMGIPLALATYVLIGWIGAVGSGAAAGLTASAWRGTWALLGDVPITIGVKLDSLTVGMYFMVTFIAFWIFVFSVGYMSGHSDEVAGKSKYHRFFAYLSLFAFSMLGLVVSSNLLFLFIFWELVGLCSYLLIGYYFHERVPQYAQMKAFITNRVGDFGFIIGMMLVYFQLGTLDLDGAAAEFARQFSTHSGIFASDFTMFGWSLATIMGVGLFCGAMGKSAQFPLHVWLPDAMAGPTPVSALIHAATMVAAGVYLVARVFRLMTPEALMFVAAIGCITLTLMALIAMVQTDIKKCLAYSTLSQLGYMIFGMGCGAWIAALFHLITHAFFKAMLFLCSGQVIEGCHHEQDMRKMGGLMKKMPVTGLTFLVGVLAISGAGIPGLSFGSGEHKTKIGLGGFFSKDEILAVAYARSYVWQEGDYEKHVPGAHSDDGDHNAGGSDEHTSTAGDAESRVRLASMQAHGEGHAETAAPRGLKHAARGGHGGAAESAAHGDDTKAAIFAGTPALPPWMFWLAIITAYVTPFYMMRAWWLTFMGKPRDEHVHHHAHESPMMYVPLVVLAVGTLVASYTLFRWLIADAAGAATDAAMVMAIDGEWHTPAIAAAHHWLMYGVGGAFVAGFLVAIAIYGRGLALATAIKRLPGVSLLHTLLDHKYYIDELYDLVWVKGCLLVSRIAGLIDTYVVDMFFNLLAGLTRMFAFLSGLLDAEGVDGIVNGVADTSKMAGGWICRPQTGRIRNYVLFASAVAVVAFACILYFGMDTGVVASSVVLSAAP
ncbi:MAG: NADH-quinone oxidoreductase subunit L [Phycisphaerae bacterium]